MDRRSFLQQSCKIVGKRLPSEYARVEYIESTGTQWIDSGWRPTASGQKYAHEITMQNLSLPTSGPTAAGTVFGNWQQGKRMGGLWLWQDYIRVSIGDGEVLNDVATPSDLLSKQTWSLDIDDSQKTVIFNKGGTLYTSTYIGDTYSSQDYGNLNIFAGLNGTETVNLRLYNFKTFETTGGISACVRYFVPVVRLSDMKPGLYDMVNDQFYVNQGTGEFLYGDIQYDIPSEYQQVEYIESDGGQYINTKMKAKSDDIIEIDYESNTHGKYIYGSFETGKQMTVVFPGSVTYQYASSQQITTSSIWQGRHKIKTSAEILYLDNTLIAQGTPATFEGTYDMLLMTTNTGSPYYARYVGKIYSYKHIQDNLLMRYFIPCYRKSDGEIGLYDLINRVFYTNQGTGTFLKGPDV